MYWAVEENDCCTRNCCGSARPFEMKILDSYKSEVIRLSRPLACQSCCFPCCLQSMEVYSFGQVLGSIEQEWTLCMPSYSIKNQNGEKVLRIEGPLCTFSWCCGDVDFNVSLWIFCRKCNWKLNFITDSISTDCFFGRNSSW